MLAPFLRNRNAILKQRQAVGFGQLVNDFLPFAVGMKPEDGAFFVLELLGNV